MARNPQGVVNPGGDAPAISIGRDQGAIEHPVEHFLAGATFDVFGEPFDPLTGVFNGVGQNRVLGRGHCDGAHWLFLQGC